MDVEPDLPPRRFRRRRSTTDGASTVSAPVSPLSNDQVSGSVVGDDASAVDPGDDAPTASATSAAPVEFDDLFDAHYERLVRALTVVAGDREVAADAVQDAFVKAHLQWKKVSRYDDPSGWVRRVAINRLRDDHRRGRRRRRALLRLGHRTPTQQPPAEIDEFDRLLAALPRQQRIATALHYVDHLPIADIADALGVSSGTVKSHLHDARRRLRPILENEADHD